MTPSAVLDTIRRRGGDLLARDGVLRYRGPREGLDDALRGAVREQKAALLAQLAAEEAQVAWRVEAMRPQALQLGGILFLEARPDVAALDGVCWSCGDPLDVGSRVRCGRCVRAAQLVIDEVPNGAAGPTG